MTPDAPHVNDLHRAAQTALREGHLRDAHQHCLAILDIDNSHADAWFMCGVIAAHNRQTKKAVSILRNALSLAPENAEYHAELGKQLLVLGEQREALEAAEAALALKPSNIPTLNTLGTLLSHCGEHEKAVSCYELAAIALQCRDHDTLSADFRAEFHFNMATSLQFAGRLEEAETAFEEAIRLRPTFFKAHSALAVLGHQNGGKSRLRQLLALRVNVATDRDRLHLGHAIASEMEALKRYEESLAELAWAKKGQAERADYQPENDISLFDAVREAFNVTYLEGTGAKGCPSPEPLFIVGMPRTGTTLVEQIIGSHSNVFPAGELQQLPRLVKRLSETSSPAFLDIETLRNAVNLNMEQLGTAYINNTRPRTGHTPHFTDKLPLNFFYLGLIRLALPRARLVCLRRDPMDTCLSNYRQLFATNFPYYHYNYDLLDCGRYYIQFDRLMRHWHGVMPGAIHEVQYEALVSDPERVCRDLLAYCELPWEDACLSFHQRKTSVATPSAVQVRQGIYTSSVDRWRRYGDAMQPLYDLLKSAGFYT